ncbi:hypothetical protein ASPSYDRAFT_90525 [Aspergillus sydowii CBS 593.65]|uniref:Phosphatidylserine decarboxylase n=1 Tax=Aspergillus sydowii CBS 593.65 TaxID=1036612 RepID=A0A1L9TG17_9EURO|nr:uncharacterized protein ASPSYDRAFT_90525 [Aspergillus sydowii CBS 593.65]OJJ58352.1 hypothetical protein ASPSYDRAFT_90525 [Aspergillus sydowii CBS 593.65]
MASVCPKPPDAIAARDIEHGPVVDFLLARHTGICCPCGVLLQQSYLGLAADRGLTREVTEISRRHHKKKVEFRSLDAPDDAGYQWCQTRGLIIIDTVVHGKVAVLLIRMAQVSSVAMSVQKEYCVQKGDKISYFLLGGSDIAIVFQNGVKFRDDLEINKTKINVRDKLATF